MVPPAQVLPKGSARPTGASRSAVLMVGAALAIAVMNYGLNLVLGWNLSVESYGQVGVAQTLIFVSVSFLQAGFPYVVARAVARGVSEESTDGGARATAWRTYKTAFVGNAALTAVLVACLLLAYRLGWLRLEAAYGPLLALVGVVVLSLGVGAVPNAGLQGLFRFGQISLARLAEVVLNVVVSVALVMLGFGAFGALAGYAAAAILVCGLYLWFLRDAPFWSTAGWSGVATVWAALPMTFGIFGTILLTNVDLLGVKLLTAGGDNSDAVVGTYEVAAVLARAPLFVSVALVDVFYPRIARESTLPGSGRRTAAARELMTWLSLGVLPMNVVMMVGAPSVLRFFFPARYSAAEPLLVALAGSMVFLILAAAITAVLQASNQPRWAATAMTSAVLVQILGVVLLVPTVGPLGAAVASLVASALAFLLLLRQARRIRLSIPNLAGHVSALIWLALLMAPLRYVEADRPLVALWVSLASTLYVASCFFVGLLDADHIARVPLLARAGRLGRPIQVVLGAARTLNALGRGAGYGATSR